MLHGAFEAQYCEPGETAITVVEGPRSLVQFLMRLLKHLQALATASAIDYEADLARCQREGRGLMMKNGQPPA